MAESASSTGFPLAATPAPIDPGKQQAEEEKTPWVAALPPQTTTTTSYSSVPSSSVPFFSLPSSLPSSSLPFSSYAAAIDPSPPNPPQKTAAPRAPRPQGPKNKAAQRGVKRPLKMVADEEIRTLEELARAKAKTKEAFLASDEKVKGYRLAIDALQRLKNEEERKAEKDRAEYADLCNAYARRLSKKNRK